VALQSLDDMKSLQRRRQAMKRETREAEKACRQAVDEVVDDATKQILQSMQSAETCLEWVSVSELAGNPIMNGNGPYSPGRPDFPSGDREQVVWRPDSPVPKGCKEDSAWGQLQPSVSVSGVHSVERAAISAEDAEQGSDDINPPDAVSSVDSSVQLWTGTRGEDAAPAGAEHCSAGAFAQLLGPGPSWDDPSDPLAIAMRRHASSKAAVVATAAAPVESAEQINSEVAAEDAEMCDVWA
jgi:hypothetical protein